MLSHEFFENVLFLLLVTGGQSHFLLSLVVHHFFDHRSRFAVQIGKFRLFRVDALHIQLRVGDEQTRPPLHFVHLLNLQDDDIAFKTPQAFVRLDQSKQVAVDDRILAW